MKCTSFRTALIWAMAVVFFDQLTKWWIVKNFMLHESRPVIRGFFDLTFVTNTGAAFGMLAGEQSLGRQVFFVTVALIALGVLYYALKNYQERGMLYVTGIGLVAGGALGNLIDRLRLGYVIDFLDVYISRYHWPAFNVADSSITVGVGVFLLAGFLETETGQDAGRTDA